jgi:sarcosine oxidase subunit beta
MQKGLGVNVRMLSLDELSQLQPQTNLDGVGPVSYHPDSGYANPAMVTNLYAKRARDMGVHIYENTEVTGIKLAGDKVDAVVTDKGEVATPCVVDAAGAWGNRVAAMVGVELPVQPTRHQVCIFKRPYNFWQPQMIYVDLPLKFYSRPEGSDLLLVGATNDVFDHDRADPDRYNENMDHDTLSWYQSRIQQRFSVMNHASFRGGYSGIYDTTPDQQPIIGPVSEVGGFYCVLGWSGHGFKHSPAIGDIMAELVTEDNTSQIDLSVFAVDRFKKGRLLKEDPY